MQQATVGRGWGENFVGREICVRQYIQFLYIFRSRVYNTVVLQYNDVARYDARRASTQHKLLTPLNCIQYKYKYSIQYIIQYCIQY